MNLRLSEAYEHHVVTFSDNFNEVNVLDQENVIYGEGCFCLTSILGHRNHRVDLYDQVFGYHKNRALVLLQHVFGV